MENRLKRKIYILLFIICGVFLTTLIHGLVEMWYIDLLLADFETYGFGLTYADWFLIHKIFSVVLLGLGFVFGYWQGVYWWPRIYGNKAK